MNLHHQTHRHPTFPRPLLSSFLTFLLASLLFALLPSLAAAQPRPLTLGEAFDRGLAHSSALQASEASVEAADARHRMAFARQLPTLTTQASYLRLSPNVPGFEVALPTAPGGKATLVPAIHNRYGLQAGLQVPLFTGFALRHGIAAASHLAAAAHSEEADTRADVTLQIEQAYWQTHKALASREAVAEAVAGARAHLVDLRRLEAAGLATRRDLLAAEMRLAEIELQQVDAETAVRTAQLTLNTLLDLPLGTDVQPEDDPEAWPVADQDDVEALVSRALEGHGALSAAEHRLLAAEAAVDVASAGRYPAVAAVANVRYARPNPYFVPPEDRFEPTWEVGLSVSYDAWDWGRRRNTVREAEAQATQARAAAEGLRDAVTLEVRRHYLGVERARAALDAADRAAEAATEALRVTRDAFQQGLATSTDVLDAEVALLYASTRRRQGGADLALARAALRHAVDG